MNDIDLLKNKFQNELTDCMLQAEKFGYNPTRFLQMLSVKGGYETAKQLIVPGLSDGFIRLYQEGRLDLSMEAQVIKPEYSVLFTKEEVAICYEKLKSCRYFDK